MELDMVADMEVYKEAGIEVERTWWPTSTSTLTWKSNFVRELVMEVGPKAPNFFHPKLRDDYLPKNG